MTWSRISLYVPTTALTGIRAFLDEDSLCQFVAVTNFFPGTSQIRFFAHNSPVDIRDVLTDVRDLSAAQRKCVTPHLIQRVEDATRLTALSALLDGFFTCGRVMSTDARLCESIQSIAAELGCDVEVTDTGKRSGVRCDALRVNGDVCRRSDVRAL